ncbi:MAG: hypothetical protein HY286_18605 [Planctomycetes bacterium]|nr:hypothetical protein [Planctomycetota bacterium]
MSVEFGFIAFLLQAGAATTTVEPFPGIARIPGYAGIRLTARGGGERKIVTFRAHGPGGHTTSLTFGVEPGQSKELIFSVYCSEPGSIRVDEGEFADGKPTHEIGRFECPSPAGKILSFGGLPDAERASDYFNIGLPSVVQNDTKPIVADSLALDGFDGIYNTGPSTPALQFYELRGGALASGAPTGAGRPSDGSVSDGNAVARAAAALPREGVRPRDFVNLQFLPARIALAAAAAGAAVALLLIQRPRLLFSATLALLAAASLLIIQFSRATRPGLLVRSMGRDDLTISIRDPRESAGGNPGILAVYPCGKSAIHRDLSVGSSTERSDGAILFASPDLPRDAYGSDVQIDDLAVALRPAIRSLAKDLRSVRILQNGAALVVTVERSDR